MSFKSWYPKHKYADFHKKYFHDLQTMFKVKDVLRKWVPYNLTEHQKHWHANDIALLGEHAKTRLCIKSRNTSFTVSSIISNIAAVPYYPEQVVPVVRLNMTRALDLIQDAKDIVRNITPIQERDGSLYPFDPSKVNLQSATKIKFPNGVEFRAFPANSQAAETIRGLRIAGSAGIVDESNFMRDFEDIYISLRDASSGSKSGKQHFQMNIGSTLKGRTTSFYSWYMKNRNLNHIKTFYWHVFNPTLFNPEVPITQQNIIPIVHWHDKIILEQKQLEDLNRFMEEYMCEPADEEDKFYKYGLITSCINPDLEHWERPKEQGMFFIGIDVASVNDYFVISIFQKSDGRAVQRYLFKTNNIELPDAQDKCDEIIESWNPYLVRIDNKGMGWQLWQYLRKKYGAIIKTIPSHSIKTTTGESVSAKEFLHTNQKNLMSQGNVELLNDELQIVHYSQWNYKFEAQSTKEFGHGDCAIANGAALLPINMKMIQTTAGLKTNESIKKIANIDNYKVQEVEW